MSEIRFRSDIAVRLCSDGCTGSDLSFYRAARAESPGLVPQPNWQKTLASCLRLRHNSPFEHGLMSVYCELPGVVWWQLTRQRFMSLDSEDFSFNLESGRYKHLDPEFYLPPKGRACREPDGFKAMRPVHAHDPELTELVAHNLIEVCSKAWERYGQLIGEGAAREVARLVLPNWAIYCDGYVAAKPLSWLQFFSKRNKTADTAIPTFPQWETEQFARRCEELFAGLWPVTHAAFIENGRNAP